MNRKGFTFVELLITIGIMAILVLFAVPLVMFIGNKIYEKLYNTKIDTLVSAAELYVQNNEVIYGDGECNGVLLSTNEACIKVSDLIEHNYAEIDTSYNNGNCNFSIGCITNPVDDTSMNDDWILVKKEGLNTIGIWKGEASGEIDLPKIIISNEFDCINRKNITIDYGKTNSVFTYKFLIGNTVYNANSNVADFKVQKNIKIKAQVYKANTLLEEVEKEVINIGNIRTITYYKNTASSIENNRTKDTCCDSGEGCNITLPNIVAKSGYKVLGWDKSSSTFAPSKIVNDNLVLKQNETYYAIIGKKLTATFNKNTASSIGATSKSCWTSGTSCTITTPSISAYSGYNVIGWNTNSLSTTSQYSTNSNISINSNITFYAITKKRTTSSSGGGSSSGGTTTKPKSCGCYLIPYCGSGGCGHKCVSYCR